MIVHAYQKGIAGQFRVLLDGVDVTNEAFLADDEAGFIMCLIVDDKNPKQRLIGPDVGLIAVGALYERKSGHVEILKVEDGR